MSVKPWSPGTTRWRLSGAHRTCTLFIKTMSFIRPMTRLECQWRFAILISKRSKGCTFWVPGGLTPNCPALYPWSLYRACVRASSVFRTWQWQIQQRPHLDHCCLARRRDSVSSGYFGRHKWTTDEAAPLSDPRSGWQALARPLID